LSSLASVNTANRFGSGAPLCHTCSAPKRPHYGGRISHGYTSHECASHGCVSHKDTLYRRVSKEEHLTNFNSATCSLTQESLAATAFLNAMPEFQAFLHAIRANSMLSHPNSVLPHANLSIFAIPRMNQLLIQRAPSPSNKQCSGADNKSTHFEQAKIKSSSSYCCCDDRAAPAT
jgi:hypothetical protein